MIHKEYLTKEIIDELEKRNPEIHMGLEIPPAVFIDMEGSVGQFSKSENSLVCYFPVLENQLNPFGNMQGGVISAAIDNTIGPLSILVADPSVTRHLEVKYKKAITPEMERITVTAQLLKQDKKFLFFTSSVTDSEGNVLATAKATHFILV
jgi:uncharacterized protein (TIGR00369 family)